VARALEAGDVVEAQPVERIGRDLGSGSHDDKGDDLLASFGVGAHDRDLDEIGIPRCSTGLRLVALGTLTPCCGSQRLGTAHARNAIRRSSKRARQF